MAVRISMYLFQKDERALDRKLLTHKTLISFKCSSVYHWLYFLRFLISNFFMLQRLKCFDPF